MGQVITFQSVLQFPPGTIPEKFQPTAHVNYESRIFDVFDDLPKFKGAKEKGVLLDNTGNEIKQE